GVLDPIRHTEDGRVLDGHHRLKLDPKAKRHVVPGSADWSDAECMAYVIRRNWQRRNFSTEQKDELRKKQKAIAHTLSDEGHKQREIAAKLGVSQSAVAKWLADNNGQEEEATFIPGNKSSLPGESVNQTKQKKLSRKQEKKAEAVAQVRAGTSRVRVA